MMMSGRFRLETPTRAGQTVVDEGTLRLRRDAGKDYLELHFDGDNRVTYEWTLADDELTLMNEETGTVDVYTRTLEARCSTSADCADQDAGAMVLCIGDWACQENLCRFECDGVPAPGRVPVSEPVREPVAEARPCSSGDDCYADEYCAYPIDADGGTSCGAAGEVGSCKEIPTICPHNIDLVCGCDGRTYTNACETAAWGFNVAHRGACS